MACFKELSEESDLTIERIRSRLIPLLKGNHLLLDWFLQCIGPDKLDSSTDEYETLILRKGNDIIDEDAETFEYIPQSEIANDPNDNPCHIRYMNGHLFYGNRFPLPAKLSFSMNPCSVLSTETAEIDKQYFPASGSERMNQYRCVHNIKQFGDSKIRDISKNHADFDHMAGDEIENSDDEPNCLTPNEEKYGFDEDIEHNPPAVVTTVASVGDHALCDDLLLRAHSMRLNPSIHTSSMTINNIELLNRLRHPHLNEL